MVVRHDIPDRPYDVALNVYADLDDFDVTFAVSNTRAGEAEAALREAFDNWHEADAVFVPLYEALELALIHDAIPFESTITAI